MSGRIGGVATVNVPYEDLEPGPMGSLFELDPEGAPPPLKAERLDLDHPYHLLANGVAPSPANGQFHLQTGTVRKRGTIFDFTGGCTIVIDPFGRVRYAIYKRLDSVERQESQLQAMTGPLKRYWRRAGKRQVPVASVFRALHLRSWRPKPSALARGEERMSERGRSTGPRAAVTSARSARA